jgi:phosphate transport system protein
LELLRPEFDDELRGLQDRVLRMGAFVETMLRDAMRALVTQDADLARAVRKRDASANEFDAEIETAAIRLLALQHPLAGDLRVVASALKIVTDLERVGDYACDIAKCAVALAGRPLFAPLEDLPRMGEVVEAMIHDALGTFVSRDVVAGKGVRDRDREVDRLYKRVFGQLVEWMAREPTVVPQAVQLLLAARYLERLGDHAKNLIERVAYMETGSRWPWRSEEWKQAHGREDAVDEEE